ncbi:hypothetical protein DAPPUDRAFT_44560 [Daphnia pulex]|uniref:serine--tRNA ligase n=1 Tax=Daphnia pulex TaxID=6669 RepID=E9G1N4_DAPPU|nr:hypothetical protein DAPPUDRAFT_44560 [Daphnia pulex]|eukprot:EFX86781.1 hypothetical protein DAPPUDRAFT_44560 [Daphnia pulex]
MSRNVQLGKLCSRIKLCSSQFRQFTSQSWEPVPDFDYLSDPKNYQTIESNIKFRKGTGSIELFMELLSKFNSSQSADQMELKKTLLAEALKIPNNSHPRLHAYGDAPHVVETPGEKPNWSFKPLEFHSIAKDLDLLRTENLGNLTGPRSYYLIKELAQLEQALIHFTVDALEKKGFILYSVPDLLHSRLIESCGMDTKSERTQVYKLEPKFYGDICLSGTAEMALASYFTGSAVPVSELPIKMAAVSRCYRAETSNVQEERGIYRVHQFTKVEMFGVTSGEAAASDALLEEFVAIQKELFSSLGLHYQLLDMPLHELGAPAYRKFDIEAWMPGRNMYGEISSASNCTDYQARRLNIQSIDSSDTRRFVHTVNGTACAVPRTLIALLETHQQSNGEVIIPAVLQPYLNGMQRLRNPTQPFKMKWIKSKAQKNKTS